MTEDPSRRARQGILAYCSSFSIKGRSVDGVKPRSPKVVVAPPSLSFVRMRDGDQLGCATRTSTVFVLCNGGACSHGTIIDCSAHWSLCTVLDYFVLLLRHAIAHVRMMGAA